MVANVRFVTRVLVFSAAVIIVPSLLSAQTTALFLDSQPGDFIGGGQRQTIRATDATFTVQRGFRSGITAQITGPGNAFNWLLELSGRFNQPLSASIYSGARRFPYAWFSPGMSFTGDSRSCTVITGWYQLLEVEYSLDGSVIRLAVDFEQHCEDSGPGLFGAFRYNSTVASLVPFAGNYPTYRVDVVPLENGKVSGDVNCNQPECRFTLATPGSLSLKAIPDPGYLFAGWVADCYGGPHTTVFVNHRKQCAPWFVPIGSPAARTLTFIDSAPGDWIGQGRKYVFAGHNSMLNPAAPNGGNALSILLDHYDRLEDSQWLLQFKAPAGQVLQTGMRFTEVGRYSTAGSQAGMEIEWKGRQCNVVSGDFLIRELALGSAPFVDRLAVEFTQHCDGGPPLVGYLQYNASVVLPTMQANNNALFFGATTATGLVTSPQQVRLVQQGQGEVTWTATADVPWLTVSPASGTGPATLTIGTQGVNVLGSGTRVGRVHITTRGTGNMVSPIEVMLTTIAPAISGPPTGSFDTPLNNAAGVTGSLPVTGWAVDDIGVVRVRILRDRVAGEAPGPPIFIGNAVLVDGARPDIAAAHSTPGNTRAGWGYLMLTNMLPNGGNGTYVLHAYADDVEGNTTLLGSKMITCTNASAIRPFGAIDTPAQGAVISGTSYDNFGWVLSPGTARADVPGGGTVNVFINGVPVGTPVGWTSRPDLTALFPKARYDGVDNALAVFPFNPSSLGDGVHTIAWSVVDNMGRGAGIGSRYFTVSQAPSVTAALLTASPALTRSLADEVFAAPLDRRAISARRGYDLTVPHRTYSPGPDGTITVHGEEIDRFELQLAGGDLTGYLRIGRELRPLPIGSHLDAHSGVFTWQPGVAFVGAYDLVFVRWADGGAVSRQDVRIVINPKGTGRVGPQVVIDLPALGGRNVTSATVAQPFVVAGWAADLDAWSGTGIATLHVWAYPAHGGAPIFLGATAYGGTRPDVGVIYGEQFTNSGYGLIVRGLPPGEYLLAVFGYSLGQGGFLPAKTVTVTVR